MSDDVARFLRMVQEKRAQEIARQQAAQQRGPAPAAPSWAYAAPPVEAEVIEAQVVEARPTMPPGQLARQGQMVQASQMGQQGQIGLQGQGPSRQGKRAKPSGQRPSASARPHPGDHQVGHLAVDESGLPVAAQPVAAELNPREALLAMLQSPASVKVAFLVAEILRRPQW